ncbi:MAG: uroporphyrinogen-III C-methyltransferase [Pseudolabrys sp.]
MTNPQSDPSQSDFDRFVAEVKGIGAAVENGSVTLVGAGPGDPELLTLRAVRALQSADVILFDDLVSRDVLDFARREARKMLVGKTGFGPSCKQDDINTLMVGLAKQGKRVVRLKGGDPLIFGRAGEEIAACKAANIAVEIVPGITAAQGAAAKLGLPLTDRAQSRRLQYITGHARKRPASGRSRLARARRSDHDHGDLYAGEDSCGSRHESHRARPRSFDAFARHLARDAAGPGRARRAHRRTA